MRIKSCLEGPKTCVRAAYHRTDTEVHGEMRPEAPYDGVLPDCHDTGEQCFATAPVAPREDAKKAARRQPFSSCTGTIDA
ncbi:hypothetical protein EMIT0158MI4_110208 [Burkholderia ambifaria]